MSTDTDTLARFIRNDREQIFTQLSQLVAFNSVHGDPSCAEDNAQAAAWVRDALAQAGLEVEAITTADGSVALLGQRAGNADAPTVLLYSHYDIVPVGDTTAWDSDPLTLTERLLADGTVRWFGRGSADCKGNVAMHLAALRALEAHGSSPLNIKVLIEGSEEHGGSGLSALIAQRPELFAADAILIADCGNAKLGLPTLTTSLRGGAQIRITLDTLATPVHSGQFGGAAPDAVKALIHTLDSLQDDEGRIQIDGVDCTGTWPGNDYPVEDFQADAQMLDGTNIMGGGQERIADMVWARPAISVTGFSSTPVESAVNAVPATASALLNLRTPASMDAHQLAEAVVAHLHAHVPWGAHATVDILEVNRGFETDPSRPALATLSQCLADSYGIPTTTTGMGGSIPLTVELQEAHPEAEIALFGIEEPKCTIHSPNESVDPDELSHIALAEALFLQRYGH